jgi:hypothetical protein
VRKPHYGDESRGQDVQNQEVDFDRIGLILNLSEPHFCFFSLEGIEMLADTRKVSKGVDEMPMTTRAGGLTACRERLGTC